MPEEKLNSETSSGGGGSTSGGGAATSGDTATGTDSMRPADSPVTEAATSSGAGQVASGLQRDLPGEGARQEQAPQMTADERRAQAEKIARDFVHAMGFGEDVAKYAVAAAGNLAEHARGAFDVTKVVSKAVTDTTGMASELIGLIQAERANTTKLASADMCLSNLSGLYSGGPAPSQRTQPNLGMNA